MTKKLNAKNISFIALCAVIITICSWINIPSIVPFTLQTFAVFFTLMFLGGFKGTISVLVYILLGTVGVPVFAGFKGGVGALLGVTGGYIIGFIFIALLYWAFEKQAENTIIRIFVMLLGLIICYTFGTLWFIKVAGNPITLETILSTTTLCVTPFILPDLAKMALAFILTKEIKKRLSKIQ